MKYTKKYNKKRKPKTQKKRPKRKSRKYAKKRVGGLFSTKKDVETKQQQLIAFKTQFLDTSKPENNTYGKKRNKLIYKVGNIIGLPKHNIFNRFNDLYQELKGPTLSCKSDKNYTDLDECETTKLEYYNDLLDSLNKIEEKLNNTVSEDRPTFDYRFKVQNDAGLVTEADKNKNVEEYELTPEDFVKIRKMEKQIKELKRYANDKIDEHKSKLGIKVLTPDEMEKEEKEKDIQRKEEYYQEAKDMKQKLEERTKTKQIEV